MKCKVKIDKKRKKKTVLDLKTVIKCSVCVETKTSKREKKKRRKKTDIYAISTTVVTLPAAPFLFHTDTLASLQDFTSHFS